MLDLFVAADAVRQKTKESVDVDASRRAPGTRHRRERRMIRSASAAALRGLAELIEPSRPATAGE
jgi:hypothetical protein